MLEENIQKNTNNISNTTIKAILDLLKNGEARIQCNTHKDIVLLLGETGTGKSTVTQYIAENNDNLVSQETVEGTGDFIIVDNNDKISGYSTITSKTIFPELFIDTKTNTTYCDCPGFSDTRNAAHDISATYFIKQIIDSADSIKLVFVVSYPSVRQGVDRQDFMSLVKHATSLIKNFDKFKDSIALVVTKVDNQYITKDDNHILVKDEMVIKGIANFLEGIKKELEKKQTFTDDASNNPYFYENAIKFIDALLIQDNQNYTKIGIFRRPDKSGTLSKIAILQDGQEALEKIINENIQFIKHDTQDFGYTISAESKNHIYGLIKEINHSITSDIMNVGNDIKGYYHKQEKKTQEIDELYNKFKLGSDYLSEAVTTKFIEPREFVECLINKISDLNINVSNKNLLNVLNYVQYLKFLQIVSSNKSIYEPLEWSHALKDVNEYLNNSKNWYGFLVDLYNRLSEYNIQQDIKAYISHLKLQNVIGENKESIINEDVLKQILDHLVKYGNIRYEDMTVNSLKLNALRDLLDITLNYKVNSLCVTPNKLVVHGQYVKLSDVVNNICPEAIKFIEVSALNKVFIDSSLDKTDDVIQLSIMAPTWEIIGAQKIILDGKSGEIHKSVKAQGGIALGLNGKDGIPGLLGGPAGNFLGIGTNFINNKQLSISVNGGDGSPGQHGGDGAVGSKGEDAIYIYSRDRLNKFQYKHTDSGDRIYIAYNQQRTYYTVYGKPGGNGGNGGNGGKGGLGGYAGEVKILNLAENKDLNININSTNGKEGLSGDGGIGGVGGQYGDTCYVIEIRHKALFIQTGKSWKQDSCSQSSATGASGQNGISGANDLGQQHPEPKTKFFSIANLVNNYKSYLIENLSNNKFNKQELIQFFNQLNLNPNIINIYDTAGLIQELQVLENQFFKFKDKIEFLPFYKSLLSRIDHYSINLKDSKKFVEHKKVLSYLYTAVLSKICLLEDSNIGNNLIINISEYLNLAINNINKLQDLNKEIIKNQYNHEYKNILDHKINEAKDIVDKMMSKIDSIHELVNGKMELLIDEVVALQHGAQAEKHQLIKQQYELENTICFKNALNIISGIAKVTSFMLPWTIPYVNLFDSVTTFINPLISDVEHTEHKKLKLPEGVKLLAENIEEFIQSIIQDKRQIVKLQQDALLQEQSQYSELSDLITDIESHPNMFDFVETQLNNKSAELKANKTISKVRLQKLLKVIENIKNISAMATIPRDIYLKYKNDQTKLDILNNAIQNIDNKIEQLKFYQDNIYNLVLPLLYNVRDHINSLVNSLDSKSQVGLMELQWKVQDYMEGIQLKIQKISQGFGVQESIVQCIGELSDVLTKMISIYDNMQVYQDHKILADYIANIHSTNSNNIVINNKDFQDSLINLEFTIKSNVIFSQYVRAINALTQYIFPFADLYFADLNLPKHLQLNKDIGSLVPGIIKHIENLHAKLVESKITIQKYDPYIHSGNFDSNNQNTGAFFTWKNSEYQDVIAKILAGEEVLVKADITKSNDQYNAIKFNQIGINLKLANKTMQSELDEQLENFAVSLTHSGNSYYRCNNEFYLIMSDRQIIHYNFAQNGNGEPTNRNLVYDKLKNSYYMLSPYTMWNIKLISTTNNNFDILNKYSKDVNIELVGYGQYISKEIDICTNTQLDKYYKRCTIASELNDVYNKLNLSNDTSTLDIYSNTPSDTWYIKESYDQQICNMVQQDNNDLTCNYRDSIQNYLLTTSSASSSNPIGYNVVIWIRDNISQFKYLSFNPIAQIKNWFCGDDAKEQATIYDFDVFGNVLYQGNHLFELNEDYVDSSKLLVTRYKVAQMSSRLIGNQKPTIINEINYDLLGNNNLLLLDLLMHKKNGVKYNHQKVIMESKAVDTEYAHSLAYSSYTPRTEANEEDMDLLGTS